MRGTRHSVYHVLHFPSSCLHAKSQLPTTPVTRARVWSFGLNIISKLLPAGNCGVVGVGCSRARDGTCLGSFVSVPCNYLRISICCFGALLRRQLCISRMEILESCILTCSRYFVSSSVFAIRYYACLQIISISIRKYHARIPVDSIWLMMCVCVFVWLWLHAALSLSLRFCVSCETTTYYSFVNDCPKCVRPPQYQ